MTRARRSNSELSRAARNLILAHGARAAGVAEIRARRLDECGENDVAQTWRDIGARVRAIETVTKQCARNLASSSRQPNVAPGAKPVLAVRTAADKPIHGSAEVSRAPENPSSAYEGSDVI